MRVPRPAIETQKRPARRLARRRQALWAWGIFPEFGFRLWPLWLWLSSAVLATAADTNRSPDPASSLRPPRGELLPTFWEQYGGWVVVAAVVALVGLSLLVWLVTRPKPAAPVPWSVQARRELEPLQGLPEDGALLSRVSQILRRHVAAAFGLTSDEATTPEFCRALAACRRIGPELTAELNDFLRETDLRKFAPSPPAAPYGAVGRSLRIVDAVEKRLAQPAPASEAPGEPDSRDSSPAGGQARVAGGV